MQPAQELIDNLYRERVLRARRTPPEEKLLAGPRLYEEVCERMRWGIRDEYPDADAKQVEQILAERIALLRRLEREP